MFYGRTLRLSAHRLNRQLLHMGWLLLGKHVGRKRYVNLRLLDSESLTSFSATALPR